MNRIRYCVMMLSACSAAVATGTLQIGDVTVENNQVVVPVVLGGDVGPGVSSLNFRLQYNPAALQPVLASVGDAAAGAEKQVLASTKQGEYIVVMMGMNQKTCSSGEVARIVLQQTGQAETSDWALGIANPTLSSSEGHVIESEALPYSGTSEDDDDDSANSGDGDKPPSERPGKPTTPVTGKPSEQPGTAQTGQPGENIARGVTPAAGDGTIDKSAQRIAGALTGASEVRAAIETPATADNSTDDRAPDASGTVPGQDPLVVSQAATGASPGAAAEQHTVAASQPVTHAAPPQQAAAQTKLPVDTKGWGIPAAAGTAFVALTALVLMRKRLLR